MSLAGDGVVAIWNDITDEGRANFYEWHNREHIPERVGVAGFLRGRRYIALAGEPQYFTLYEVLSQDVLSGPSYLERLNSPTPWTTESVRHFRNVSRSLCVRDWSGGVGSGGFLGTLRFDADPAGDARRMAAAVRCLSALLEGPGIVGAHVCRADQAASKMKTAEQRGRPENAVPRWVVLVEGSTEEAVGKSVAIMQGDDELTGAGTIGLMAGLYRLQFDLLGTDRRG